MRAGTGVSTAFELNLGLLQLILAFFFNSLADEERKLVPGNLLRRFRISRDLQLLASAIFFVSIAPVSYTTNAFNFPVEGGSVEMPVRGALWLLTLLLNWIRRPLEALAARIKRESS
jgi:hypothetical protein